MVQRRWNLPLITGRYFISGRNSQHIYWTCGPDPGPGLLPIFPGVFGISHSQIEWTLEQPPCLWCFWKFLFWIHVQVDYEAQMGVLLGGWLNVGQIQFISKHTYHNAAGRRMLNPSRTHFPISPQIKYVISGMHADAWVPWVMDFSRSCCNQTDTVWTRIPYSTYSSRRFASEFWITLSSAPSVPHL